jgi:suppressor for copper-sensitivity B
MPRFSVFCALFLAFAAVCAPARAQESPWKPADDVQARLIGGATGVGTGDSVSAGLEMKLADGWHAYWKMPGESGLPPHLDWSGSTNLASAAMDWPLPKRMEIAGLQSFVYDGTVLFPLTIKPAKPGQPVSLALKAEIMVCRDICVPQTLNLSLDIPAGAANPAPFAPLIAHAEETVPRKGDLPALSIKGVVLGPDALVAQIYAQEGIAKTDLFVDAGGSLFITAKPEITPDAKDPRNGMLKIAKPDGVDNLAKALSGKKLTLTLSTADGKAIEKEYPF